MFGKSKKKKEEELNKFFADKSYRKKVSRKNKTEKLSFGFILTIMIFVFLIVTGYLVYLSQSLPSLSELENPKIEEATKIYSDNGELIDKFFLKNRTKVKYTDIPKDMINALVATEDRKFFSHWGVDLQRIGQALIKNLITFRKKEGASTITQQLAGNLYLNRKEMTYNRKLREAMTAVQIERTYTKEEILTYYLNTVYFGKGAYGIEAAANTFFSKSSKELNLDECAILVATLKSPTNYDPTEQPENSKNRRNLVLNAMFEESYITKDVYESSIAAPIRVSLNQQEISTDSRAPEFTEYVRQLLQDKAEKYGFDLYRDGLKVYTTLDTRFQKHANDAVTEQLKGYQKAFNGSWNWKNNKDILESNLDKFIKYSEAYKKATTEPDKKKVYDSMKNNKVIIDSVKIISTTVQVGFVVMNPKTGEIKAMVGSNPNTRTKYGLNHVTQVKRQPGSSFKPFVYAVAVNNGYSPGYQISNEPLSINMGGKMWSPKGGGTGGMVSMRLAIEKSINVVAVRTAMELAPIDKVIELAHKMGIKSELPNFLSLALGVGEVTPLEMTNAYGTFDNEGIWVEPIAITKIEDRNGNVIEEVVPETREVMSEETAYIMTDMMEGVVNDGTASSIRQFFHRPAAGKTGTSQSFTDAWFVGYTPQFVAGCWLGFDDARVKFGGAYGQGGKAAAPIWGRFMKLLYSDEEFDFPVEYFLMPEGAEEMNICTISGLLAGPGCPGAIELINKKLMPRKCPGSHIIKDSLASAPIDIN
ncbi:MAG: PBP1A family penicillin-binding protein [Ignavibacteriae bacterium]|nr:PBP1A family penicillin-binding protein [Ignavibacteriota bacterium]